MDLLIVGGLSNCGSGCKLGADPFIYQVISNLLVAESRIFLALHKLESIEEDKTLFIRRLG